MIQASLDIEIASNWRQRWLDALSPLFESTGSEVGCTRCTLWENTADVRRLRFMTQWQSSADLDRYLKSHRFKVVLVATYLSGDEPDIEIHTRSESHGFEYIRELWGPDSPDGEIDTFPGDSHGIRQNP